MGVLPYNVSIWKKANGQLGRSCDCMYANDGNRCKHMAAVLIKIEKENREYEQQQLELKLVNNPNEPVHPFVSRNVAGAEKYTCFDLAKITKYIKFTKKEFTEAKKLIENNSMKLQFVKEGFLVNYYGESIPVLDIKSSYEKDNNIYLIDMRLTSQEIVNSSCGVPRCINFYYGYSKKMCKHQLATLLLLDDYIDKYNPGDTTDVKVLDLIEGYQKGYRSDLKKKGNFEVFDLRIEPRMELSFDGLWMSFKVGTQKTYVLKNLDEFIQNIEGGNKQIFGTKTEIDFGIHKLCNESVEVL